MLSGAEPLSLTVRLGQVVIASSPEEHAPVKLDWGRWVVNTALRYEQFETPSPRRIFLLDRSESRIERISTGALQYARQDMATANILELLAGWSEGTLALLCGPFHTTTSSWLESMRQVALASYGAGIGTLLQRQLDCWREVSSAHRDDSQFVLSDASLRFLNASQQCDAWMKRLVRSRVVSEARGGSWAAGILRVHAAGDGLGRQVRVHRLVSLDPTEWCGDPEWEHDLADIFKQFGPKIHQLWISVPFAGMVSDITARMARIGLTVGTNVIAPSVILGWHPLRDLYLFLGGNQPVRLLVYMDSQERLQFIALEEVHEEKS